MLVSPDKEIKGGENTKNTIFTQGVAPKQGIFEVLKIKGHTRIVAGCSYNILPFEANLELGDNQVMQRSFAPLVL